MAKPLDTVEQRKLREIYKEAGIKPVAKKPSRLFGKYRREWDK